MKIKNKFKYIFVFGIILAVLLTLSINIFAMETIIQNNSINYITWSGYAQFQFKNIDYIILDNIKYDIDSTKSSFIKVDTSSYYHISIFLNGGTYQNSNISGKTIYYYGSNSYFYINLTSGLPKFNGSDISTGDTFVINNSSFDLIRYIGANNAKNETIHILYDGPTSQSITKTYNTGSFYNSGDEYDQIQVIGMSSNNSTFESVTSIDYINTVTTARDTVYSSSAWNGNYSSTLSYYYGNNAPNITSLNNDLNNIITFTTNVMASNLTLDFNTGQFYNNNGSYTSISVTGTTLNGSTFNSITSIAYKDTSQSIVDTAYNGGWNSGFSSQLSYYANQNMPTISSLNSSCNNIITFTLNSIAVSYQNTFVTGDFINAGDIYNRIDIIGTSSDNSTFITITSIDYVDTNTNARDTVYSNGTWNGNYNNTLLYYSTMNQPNISAVNNATNGIITFSVSLYSGSYEKTYNLTFYNNNNLYSSIKLIGTTSDNVKFNTINTIYYGNEPVYINGWEQGFSSVLVQYDFMNELDLSQVNLEANNIIIFTKIHVDSVDPSIKNNMLEGVQVIFYPITSFIGLAQTSFPIAVILIMNVVGLVAVVIFSFVKRNKE